MVLVITPTTLVCRAHYVGIVYVSEFKGAACCSWQV